MTAKQLAQYFEDMTVALQEALRPGAKKSPKDFRSWVAVPHRSSSHLKATST